MTSFYVLAGILPQGCRTVIGTPCQDAMGGDVLRHKHSRGVSVPTRSKAAASQVNSAFKQNGLTYAASPTQSQKGLSRLKQHYTYPDLCDFSQDKAYKYLSDHGVISEEKPTCWSCFEIMTPEGRNKDTTYKCKNASCYIRPHCKFPRELYTPLHAVVRQCGDVDYKAFLQCCFLIGIKTPVDQMPHFVKNVGRSRLEQWAQEIRLACATAEYVASMTFSFSEGILEYDTAATSVQRTACKKTLRDACRQIFTQDRSCFVFLEYI